MAPKKIGPYVVEDKLGAGGMGEVFRAYDDRLDRRVAIKLIRPEALASVEARRRFRREARAAARLSHPAIVQIHDILENETGDCIVMELVEGQPLSRLLAAGPVETRRALQLGREIAEGLAEAHAKQIVHRDLKADNVMVTPAGHVKILDFGLAKRLSHAGTDLSVEGKILGTVHAMSPEQAQGFEVDHRSDLFSLGTLLYQVATHRSPFQSASPVQTLARITTFRQSPAREVNPRVPEALSRLIDHLLEKDPVHRPRSADEVASALDGIATALNDKTLNDKTLDDKTLEATADDETLPQALTLSARPRGLNRPGVASPSHDSHTGNGTGAIRRRVGVAAALILTLLLGLLGTWALRQNDEQRLYVAVLRPRIESPESLDANLVVSAVRLALVQALLSLQGISTLDPDEVDTVSGSASQVARALGVDEVVTSKLTCGTEMCQVELKRISGVAGTALWVDLPFSVPHGELLDLTSGVIGRLQTKGYPEHKARENAFKMDVHDGDYEEFLRHLRSWKTRPEGVSLPDLLEAVTMLESTSPRFPEAYFLEARIAQSLFTSSRRPEYLERALDAIRRVRERIPGDPRALFYLFNIAFDGARLDLAEEALESLRRTEPGHGRIMAQQALLLQVRGQTEEALETMRVAVQRHSSWSNLMDLARMERQLGEFGAARDHLRELLALSPDNYQALFQLANTEMVYGNLEEAIELFKRLNQQTPSGIGPRQHIALNYFGLARYEEAAWWYQSILELQPDHLPTLSSFAFTQHLRGEQASARMLSSRALELADQTSDMAQARLHFLRAMALVPLGEDEQAVEAVQRILPMARESPFTAWQAALIYAAVGDKFSARANVRKALEQGLTPRWFEAPVFDLVKDE